MEIYNLGRGGGHGNILYNVLETWVVRDSKDSREWILDEMLNSRER